MLKFTAQRYYISFILTLSVLLKFTNIKGNRVEKIFDLRAIKND